MDEIGSDRRVDTVHRWYVLTRWRLTWGFENSLITVVYMQFQKAVPVLELEYRGWFGWRAANNPGQR